MGLHQLMECVGYTVIKQVKICNFFLKWTQPLIFILNSFRINTIHALLRLDKQHSASVKGESLLTSKELLKVNNINLNVNLNNLWTTKLTSTYKTHNYYSLRSRQNNCKIEQVFKSISKLVCLSQFKIATRKSFCIFLSCCFFIAFIE